MTQSRNLIPGINDLVSVRPDFIVEWNDDKNGTLKPSDLVAGSKTRVWWTGKCGHDWSTRVVDRSRKTSGCPYCSGRYTLKGFNDLGSLRPEFIKLWDDEANGELTPYMVTVYSAKRVNWQCHRGHTWEAAVHDQVRQVNPCSVCSGRRLLAGYNCLDTLRPELAKEWHPTKNGELLPSDFLPRSKKKVYWLGKCGHEWHGKIIDRVKSTSETGCPACCGKQTLPGFNDLQSQAPITANLWNQAANGDVLPTMVTPSSNKSFWWKCLLNHTWKSRVIDQVKVEEACPFCSNRKMLEGFNSLQDTHPDLTREWHPSKNTIEPSHIMAGSRYRAWWKCEYDHAWSIPVSDRTRKGSKCPTCMSQRLHPGFNCLHSRFPEIAKEWHPIKNGKRTPESIMPGHNIPVWWVCPKGHEWRASPNARTSHKRTNCSVCNHRTILAGYNDLKSVNPQLAAEWHPIKNGSGTPQQVTAWSHSKVWWHCANNHEWQATIGSRANGNNCPVCNCGKQTSKPEEALRQQLKKTYPSIAHAKCLPIKWGKAKFAAIDIWLPTKKVAIEYDGWYWHKDKFKQDRLKTQALLDAGYKVIRVRAKPLRPLQLKHPNLRQISHPHGINHIDAMAKEIISLIRA